MIRGFGFLGIVGFLLMTVHTVVLVAQVPGTIHDAMPVKVHEVIAFLVKDVPKDHPDPWRISVWAAVVYLAAVVLYTAAVASSLKDEYRRFEETHPKNLWGTILSRWRPFPYK